MAYPLRPLHHVDASAVVPFVLTVQDFYANHIARLKGVDTNTLKRQGKVSR